MFLRGYNKKFTFNLLAYILHLTPSYKPAWIYGGPTLSVSQLAEAQARLGARVDVLTTTANGPEELPVAASLPQSVAGVSVRYYPRWTGDHSHFSPALLAQLWRSARSYEVVHIHSWWNLVAMPAVLVCWLRGVRPVLSPRGMLSHYGRASSKAKLKAAFHQLLGRWLLRKTVLHATSGQEAREALALLPGWPYFIAPNLIGLPDSPSVAAATSGPLRLVFLSRIHPKKGLDLLFPALAALPFPWELTLVGAGEPDYEVELKTLAIELGIADRLHWLGWMEGPAKYESLAQADLMVLPSRNENFANVVLESLAVGVPVLLTDQVGLSEYVAEKGLGWVCAPTARALEAALKTAYTQREKYQKNRAAIAQTVRADFAPDRVAQQYLEAYAQCAHAPA